MTKKHQHNFVFQGKAEPGYDYSDTMAVCSCGAAIFYDRNGIATHHPRPAEQCQHLWDKWQETDRKYSWLSGGEITQERKCLLCGLREIKRERF